MVYDTDFYTTRRPYSSRPVVSSYSVTRRGVDWEKVPFVPRPSLVPDPITAFGKKKPRKEVRESILKTINREAIQPDPRILNRPIDPYVSPRDQTREKILSNIRRNEYMRDNGIYNAPDSMDVVLPRLHGTAQVPTERRHIVFFEPGYARNIKRTTYYQ